jgi:diguanylate cyclase (GGDEF)-like protein
VAANAHSETSTASGYEPFAQLIRMLMPSARSVALYDARPELVWCSDGYERPDLRALLEQQRASETVASRGSVDTTSSGIPVFISGLRGADARPLGSVVIELGGGGSSRSTPSMVVSMLRPVLDCLESKLDLDRHSAAADRSAGLDLLLGVEEGGHEEANGLQQLLNHCAKELRCVMGALIVPDKNLELTFRADESSPQPQVLDRTQKHLLAWARLNNRPMVVNRAAVAAPYKILSCPVRDPNGSVLGLVALFRSAASEDFESRDVRILEFVSRKAVAILDGDYDSLTGLPNRSAFERRAQCALRRAPAAVLYVDIDSLETINETFGLSAGDEVIQRVGTVIQRTAGGDVLIARLGGDRFAVALPERTAAQGNELAADILAAVSQLGYLNGSDALKVSVSIGVVVGPAGERITHVLAAAELACKRAKASGGARAAAIAELETLTPAAARQAIAAADLRDALASNQFQLDAQPIVGLRARGEIAGFELLVRLRNAAGELAAPDKFLDACAQYGLLAALDRWVLLAAVEGLRPHAQVLAQAPLFFAVNVSDQSLQSRKYAAFALHALAAAGLPPSMFCFELKEPAAIAHLAAADALIRDLNAAGARTALDDFGSGLSSLAHLKQLTVSYLKIDGAFVRRIGADRVSDSIVSGIARAARTLGIPTVAEHVESAAIAERLRELDVTLGQGFYFGRPQPFAETVRQAVMAAQPAVDANTLA